MKIEVFKLLTSEEQKKHIWNQGKFLVTYTEGKGLYDAYELFEFYVALCYQLNACYFAGVITAIFPDELPYVRKIRKIY